MEQTAELYSPNESGVMVIKVGDELIGGIFQDEDAFLTLNKHGQLYGLEHDRDDAVQSVIKKWKVTL